MAPFGREPGVVEVEPAHQRADVEGGLDRIEFERGARHQRAARQRRAGDDRPEVLDAAFELHRQHRAGQRVEQHVARGVVGLLRIDLVVDDVVGDVDHRLVGIRADGGTGVEMAHAGVAGGGKPRILPDARRDSRADYRSGTLRVARVQRTDVAAALGRAPCQRAIFAAMDKPLPALFLSHGSPMLAVQDSLPAASSTGWATQLPPPRAIVVASAHFTAAPTHRRSRAAADRARLRRLPAAAVRNPLPGAGLARAGRRTSPHAWPPPASQPHERTRPRPRPRRLGAVATDVSAGRHPGRAAVGGSARRRGAPYAVGRALAPLRDEGVLVIGSGGFVHNLGDLDWQHPEAPMRAWARDFAEWMRARLEAHDLPALLDWQQRAPHARHAHPTVEHLMPLFVALGAARRRPGDAPPAPFARIRLAGAGRVRLRLTPHRLSRRGLRAWCAIPYAGVCACSSATSA